MHVFDEHRPAVKNFDGVTIGGRCVGHEGMCLTPRFFEANVKSLVLIIGAPPDYILTISVPFQLSLSPPAYENHYAKSFPELVFWAQFLLVSKFTGQI